MSAWDSGSIDVVALAVDVEGSVPSAALSSAAAGVGLAVSIDGSYSRILSNVFGTLFAIRAYIPSTHR